MSSDRMSRYEFGRAKRTASFDAVFRARDRFFHLSSAAGKRCCLRGCDLVGMLLEKRGGRVGSRNLIWGVACQR